MSKNQISLLNRLLRKIIAKFIRSIEKLIVKRSLVEDRSLYQLSDFPDLELLEKNTSVITLELDNLLKKFKKFPAFEQIHEQQYGLTQDGKWTIFPLYGFGMEVKEACQLCPNTVDILNQIPGMKTAFFSKLEPQKHIPPHTGIYRGILRVHLGLKIPQKWQDCYFQVEDQKTHWREGKCFVFDDGYIHQVHNNTEEERIVLIVDILRPLPKLLHFLNKLIVAFIGHGDHIQVAGAKMKTWLRSYDAAKI